MQKVILGRTGLEVSVACLGTGGKSRLGQAQGVSFDQSVSVVRAALDMGVTLVDTATGYGTEAIVGAALRGVRDNIVISTKLRTHRAGTPVTGTDLVDRNELQHRLESSLRALETDYIDLLHLHAVMPWQYDHCLAEFVPALLEWRDAGKIRFLCITERFAVDKRHETLERAIHDDIWDVVMCGYNYLNQSAAKAVLPTARAANVGTMGMFAVRGPLADPEHAKVLIDRLVTRGEIDPAKFDDPDDPLGFMTQDGAAASLADAAYRFCRHGPGIDVVAIGTGSIEHLKENIRSVNGPPLPQAVLARIANIFGDVRSETGEP